MNDQDKEARIARIILMAGNDGDGLDDMIIEAKMKEASNINNDGPEEQVQWLIENGFTLDEIENGIG